MQPLVQPVVEEAGAGGVSRFKVLAELGAHPAIEAFFRAGPKRRIPDQQVARGALALRRLEAPREVVALRSLHAEFAAAGSARARAFIAVADGLVDATDTARDMLRDHLPTTSSSRPVAAGLGASR